MAYRKDRHPRGGIPDSPEKLQLLDHMLAAFSRKDQNDPGIFAEYIAAFSRPSFAPEQTALLFMLTKLTAMQRQAVVTMPAVCPPSTARFHLTIETMVSSGLIVAGFAADGINMSLTMNTINEMDTYLRRQKCDPILN